MTGIIIACFLYCIIICGNTMCTCYLIAAMTRRVHGVSKNPNLCAYVNQMATNFFIFPFERTCYSFFHILLHSSNISSETNELSAMFRHKYVGSRFFESENHKEFIDRPVQMKGKPHHCGSREEIAQSMKAQFSGFSVSNLQRWYHFSVATPASVFQL